MAKTVLIVEDDRNIADLLRLYLEKEGYEVAIAYTGIQGVEKFREVQPSLILLDVMLPEMDGWGVCRTIRAESKVPIIMLTAKGDDMDKILGLEYGADDYITKPFSVRELMARVKANLRKAELANVSIENGESDSKEDSNIIIVGDLSLDLNKFEVKVRGEVMDLTLREFEVLKYLANQPGQVVTREVLLEKVWGYEYYGDIRTVDVTVRRIREKIEKDTSNPKILITKRGVGYYIASK